MSLFLLADRFVDLFQGPKLRLTEQFDEDGLRSGAFLEFLCFEEVFGFRKMEITSLGLDPLVLYSRLI